MSNNALTPERVLPLPGPGGVFDARRNSPDTTLTTPSVEALAAEFLARRYGFHPVVARLVAELAGLGRRVG